MLRRALSAPARSYCSGSHSGSKDASKAKGLIGPSEFSCGLRPYSPPKEPPALKIEEWEFPAHLIRPPCLPGDKRAKSRDCMSGPVGLFCPPCRIKYKYPCFSENIDFVPGNNLSCWWRSPLSCEKLEEM